VNPTLTKFATELLRWNERINLTAARTMDDALQHIEDSAAILSYIPEGTKRLIDVGSGGGLPAAVIAIERPEIAVTALEPVHKKLAFLQHAKRLFCANLEPRAERVEQHAVRDYDVATSRATFALPTWLSIGRRLVHPGGLVLAMEGAEQFELPPGATRHPYAMGDRTRAIVVLPVSDQAADPVGG
jgi:16S rRNA (guanine527-N7)-methyltransferase